MEVGHPYYDYKPEHVLENKALSSKLMADWDGWVCSSQFVPQEEVDEWCESLHNCKSKQTAIALLLILLPNIKSLTVSLWLLGRVHNRVRNVIKHVSEINRRESSIPYSVLYSIERPLSNLENVTLELKRAVTIATFKNLRHSL